MVLTLHHITEVDGRFLGLENNNDLVQEESPWLSSLKREEIVSMAARAFEYTGDDYLLKQIIPILDKKNQQDLIRILISFTKDTREIVAVILSGLAWKTTDGCPRLSQAMDDVHTIELKRLYPIAKLFYNDEVVKKLSTTDQQVLATAEQKIKNSAQLLCQ